MAQRKHAELIKQWADDDGLVIEFFLIKEQEWVTDNYPEWLDTHEYRIKSTKPSIDWSHVADEYVQMATDANGGTYLHQKGELVSRGFGWGNRDTSLCYASAQGFKSFKRGTCDWKDSLVQRPEETE